MDAIYKPGQRLILELERADKIFEGDYKQGTGTRVDLVNVVEYRDYRHDLPKQGVRSFYKTEITGVVMLDQVNQEEDEETAHEQPSGALVKVMDLPKKEYHRLRDMTKGFTYMATREKQYFDAVKHLLNCERIGVVGIGSERGKAKDISLLVLSSWDQIYLFDFILFRNQGFPQELKEILECPGITKVIHDSKWLLDCLSYMYKLKVPNVFDTLVADVTIEKRKTGVIPDKIRSLPACLEEYLKFPKTLLSKAYEVGPRAWLERPLTPVRKMYASQFAGFLITLMNKQHDIMNQEFKNSCEMYGQLLKHEFPCQIAAMNRELVAKGIFK